MLPEMVSAALHIKHSENSMHVVCSIMYPVYQLERNLAHTGKHVPLIGSLPSRLRGLSHDLGPQANFGMGKVDVSGWRGEKTVGPGLSRDWEPSEGVW
jgi:hypothetical protein